MRRSNLLCLIVRMMPNISHSPETPKRKSRTQWGRGGRHSGYALFLAALFWLLTLTACDGFGLIAAPGAPLPTQAAAATTPTAAVLPATLPPLRPTYTPLPSLTPLPSPTVPASPTPVPSATPDLYQGLTIAELAARPYGGGLLQIEDTIEYRPTFTRYLITYPSDGLQLYGFMNVPEEGEKFPVVIVLHGYIEPEQYRIKDYTTRYADALAEAGYMVFHPNYRNYPPSDTGPNPYRIGYAVDVMNLIAIIKQQSLDPTGTLRRADGNRIYLLGHSMGGGIALRVLAVWPEAVRAAVLYGSMSGDEARNFERISAWSEGQDGEFEMSAPPATLAAISPIYHLDRIQAPLSIHHGGKDDVVPLEWSQELCQMLTAQNHVVECFTYEAQGHTFYGDSEKLFEERVVSFFRVW